MIKLLLLVLATFSCQNKNSLTGHCLINQHWEFKMISSGDNRPNFSPTNDSIHFIPILLNEGFGLGEIREHFNWSDKGFDEKVETLLEAEFLKKDKHGNIKTNVLVFALEDGMAIKKSIFPVAKEITESIKARYKSIISKTKQIDCLMNFDFEEISLFILSDILLDDGQIENVEQEYLKTERPLRGGSNYYASYLGKPKGSLFESFNIYGNQVENHDGFALCRYGNQRQLPEVLKTNERLGKQYENPLKRSQLNIPVITPKCNEDILMIANDYKPELLRILRKHHKLMKEGYAEFGYDKQVTYEEYFIWMYHILYSEVTDNLIDEELIVIPKEKAGFYILQF